MFRENVRSPLMPYLESFFVRPANWHGHRRRVSRWDWANGWALRRTSRVLPPERIVARQPVSIGIGAVLHRWHRRRLSSLASAPCLSLTLVELWTLRPRVLLLVVPLELGTGNRTKGNWKPGTGNRETENRETGTQLYVIISLLFSETNVLVVLIYKQWNIYLIQYQTINDGVAIEWRQLVVSTVFVRSLFITVFNNHWLIFLTSY